MSAADQVNEAFYARLDELPKRIQPWYQVGQPGFAAIGKRYLQLLQETCGLNPSSRMLDMGCGIGRISVHFAPYLKDAGCYTGTDIVPEAIEWAQSVFAPLPHFEFIHSNIHNPFYNPAGTEQASRYRFPSEDNSYDVVLLTSVFTHMLPKDVANYLRELARCTAQGGKILATAYLINDQAKSQMRAGHANRKFLRCGLWHYAPNRKNQEACMGLSEKWMLRSLRSAGLKLDRPIDYGSWSGVQPNSGREQDMMVLTPTSTA